MPYYPPVQVIETELGKERLCRGCQEWWPQDDEFWYFNNTRSGRKVAGRCKACWSERQQDAYGKRRWRNSLSVAV